MKRSRHIFGFLLLTASLAALLGCGSGQNHSATSIVTFSDVHFNPFYDPTLFDELLNAPEEMWADIFKRSSITEPASWGNETNYPLLVQAMSKLQNQSEQAAVAIFSGDILAHEFGEKFVSLYGKEDQAAQRAFVFKTVKFFASQVRESLGAVPVVYTNGNNDGYEEDYKIAPSSQYFSDTAEEFYTDLLLGTADHANYLETYKAGGYFSLRIPGSNLTIISLNTVFFSPKAASGIEAAISAELNWLENNLSDARENGSKVWIVMHIPPGIDIYSSTSKFLDANGHVTNAVGMWREDIQQRYLTILRNYADVLNISFAGHTHMDEFRLSLNNADAAHGAVIVIPSISPISTNNPAIKLLSVEPNDWTLNDYSSIAYLFGSKHTSFKDYYTFSSTYDLRNELGESLSQLYPTLNQDEAKRQAFIDYYYSGNESSSAPISTKWKAYWCGAGNMAKADFIACVNSD